MREIKGDLIKLAKAGEFDVIVHGCNCMKRMQSGIAKTVVENFPKIVALDNLGMNVLGDIKTLDCHGFILVNAYTQIKWGKSDHFTKGTIILTNGELYEVRDSKSIRYLAIRVVMEKINIEFKGKKVGFPLIGCGLAGLSWVVVREIIDKYTQDCDVTIVHFDK